MRPLILRGAKRPRVQTPHVPLEHWLTLALTKGLGPVRIRPDARRLRRRGGGLFKATHSGQLARLDGFGQQGRPPTSPAACGTRGETRATANSTRPTRSASGSSAATTSDYPPLLLDKSTTRRRCCGCGATLQPRDLNAVGVVGSRRPGGVRQGAGRAVRLACLATAGFTVVSGGAYGIDTAAHRGALRADGRADVRSFGKRRGRAVPAGERGAFPPNRRRLRRGRQRTPASAHSRGKENFPRRNRIISGLSPRRARRRVRGAQRRPHHRPAGGRAQPPGLRGAGAGRQPDERRAAHMLLRTGAFLAATLEDISATTSARCRAASAKRAAGLRQAPLFDAARAARPVGDEARAEADAGVGGTTSFRSRRRSSAGHASPDAIIDATDLPASAVQAALMMLSIKGVGEARRGRAI